MIAAPGTLRRAANAERRIVADRFRPLPKLSVTQWADRYRILSREGSFRAGPYNSADAPYQREPQDLMGAPNVPRVVIMWGSQLGKTEMINNFVGFRIDQEPGPILNLQPTLAMAETWSKDRLAPMIRDTPRLRGKVADVKSRDSGNTMLHKSFANGHLTVVGANSAAGLASRPIRDLIQDEVERYPLSAGSEGDPSSIAESRTATFPNRKNIKVSSPTTEQGPIWKEWLQSDQRWRWWPCPHCGHEQKMAFGGKDTTFGLKWDEGRPDSAHYVCAACACIIGDADKLWMDTRGRWIAENPESNIPGFRLSAIYSQFYSWADLVERWMKDHREPLKLRTFLNTMLCETWNDDGEQVTEHVLQAHKSTFPRGPDPEEDPQMIVPHGVGVLTRSVDMQGDRLEMAVWGWGEEEEAWRVDFKILEGDPSTREPWIKLLAELKRTYVHESGAKVQVARTFLDSGGGNTQQAYNFARKHRALRIFATKGSSKQAGVEFCIGPKRNRSARILMYELGSYTLKVALMKRLLKITEPGPGYIHLPHDIEEDELDQFLNEKLTPRMVGSREVKAWIQIGPNEQIDLFAYALAALNSLGTATMGALGKAATDLSNWKPPIVKQAEASPLDALRRSPARKNYATDWKRGR